jgi:hypothetical protein
MEQADYGFVWETSLKVRLPHGESWRDWRQEQGERVRADLDAPASRVVVMDGGDVIVGFAHFMGGVLRMIYVKRDLRGFGYGMDLLRDALNAPLYVYKPNPCFRRWTHTKGLAWREL